MLRFNQTKHRLSWSMSGQAFECEPWGSVEIPENLWEACVSRGLPLGITATAPEQRAQERIEDEKAARERDAFAAVLKRAEAAEADANVAKAELGRTQIELSEARAATVKADTKCAALASELARTKADKEAAEQLLSQEAKRAEEAELKFQKLQALSAEKKQQPKREARAE